MRTTDEMIKEIRARNLARTAERDEIKSRNSRLQRESPSAKNKSGGQSMGAVVSEGLGTVIGTIQRVDNVIQKLEYLRLELIQVAVGERLRQTALPPEMDDLARELGGINVLLKLQESLDPKAGSR